jgi:hypothetical protein
LARVHLLNGYDDLDLIDQYAARFGQDPDWVYNHISFGTIMNFAVKWKLQSEFQDRFNAIWTEINSVPTK